MRRVVAQRPGPLAEVLALEDVPEPVPGAGEVAVRMIASTINPSDVVTVSGAYASRTTFPFVPGFEGVGVVSAVGPGVSKINSGDRVLPLGTAGCWQQTKIMDASWCLRVPDDLADLVACFAYVNPLTAWLMVARHLPTGAATALVSAASSTIAGHLAQLLNERGVRPVGVVRGEPGRVTEPWRWAAVVSTAEPGWQRRLRALAPRGFDVGFDCVGGRIGGELVHQLADGAELLHYGLLSGEPLPGECFSGGRGTRVTMFRLRDVVHATPHDQLPSLVEPVFTRLRRGLLRTPTAQDVPLSQLVEVLRGPSRPGKLLIGCQG